MESKKEEDLITYQPTCVRNVTNWSNPSQIYNFEKKNFNPTQLFNDIESFSPKMKTLLQKINDLDKKDLEKENTLYKHFIFTDLKSSAYGAKMIASALIANGLTLGFEKRAGKLSLLSDTELEKSKNKSFYLLSSVAVYDKPMSVATKKEILRRFNERPNNSHGENIRFIILDSGFKEGIDLFDVKYVHLFEPSLTMADQKQVIGRGTRTCGQMGLNFNPTSGWPLYVFIYDVEIPQEIRHEFKNVKSLFDLYIQSLNVDLRLLNFTSDLEQATIEGAVDYDLNKLVHTFKVEEPKEESSTGIPNLDQALDVFRPIPTTTKSSKHKSSPKSESIKSTESLEEMMSESPTFTPPPSPVEEKEETEVEEPIETTPTEFTPEPIIPSKNPTVTEEELSPLKEEAEEKNITESMEEEIPEEVEAPIAEEEEEVSSIPEEEVSSIQEEKEGKSEEEKEEMSAKGGNKGFLIRHKDSGRLSHDRMKSYIERYYYPEYAWTDIKMENLCGPPPTKTGGKQQMKKKTHGGDLQPEGKCKDKTLKFTPTQGFISSYFTPNSPVNGMLLYHSVGTGKTCTAIATATNKFEEQGYTILWVTRTTLKNDIWKNMFNQVCHEVFRKKIANCDLTIPTDNVKRMRMLSPSWKIRPMSYKQFSNMILKKNQFYIDLVKINGVEDPLRKTLLIIDEAHKLYGGTDLMAIEKPDMGAFHKALMNSYTISGVDSVKLLLMTATPITQNPMELIQLINLCKPLSEQMPEVFADFAKKYLDATGKFTAVGKRKYLDDISGYISYLNRERDARQFSQPIIKHITTSMMRNVKDIEKFSDVTNKKEIADLQRQIKEETDKIDKQGLSKVTKKDFEDLNKICVRNPNPKECNKIADRQISELLDEIKQYKNSIKAKISILREKMKQKKEAEIKMKKVGNEFENFKKSAYSVLKAKCGIPLKDDIEKEITEYLKREPEILNLDAQIEALEKQIEKLKEQINFENDRYKQSLKSITGLPDKYRYELLNGLKEQHEKIQKETGANNQTMNYLIKQRGDLTEEKKVRFTELRTSVKAKIKKDKKQRENEEKKQKKEEAKIAKKTMKISTRVGSIKENEMVKELMEKYTKRISDSVNKLEAPVPAKKTRKVKAPLEPTFLTEPVTPIIKPKKATRERKPPKLPTEKKTRKRKDSVLEEL